MTSPVAISAKQVNVHYLAYAESRSWRRQEIQVPALTDVSLELRQGDALGVVGHNGCGKSTLLQAIAGLVPITSGEILVSSQPQLLSVAAALDRRLSGYANIRLCALALGIPASEIDNVRQEVAEFTELEDFLDLQVDTYSAGMRSRLAFAISAVARPEILLMDEALAVGDYRFKQRCIEKLCEIRDQAGVVVLATHVMSEIRETCSSAIWLHEGRVERVGDPDEIATAYEANWKDVNRRL